jgi:hypothetical protein
VAPGGTAGAPGELRLRDLGTGAESVIAPAGESPRHPTTAGGVIAWEALDNGRAVVRVRANGATDTMSGGFDHAGEPRAAADAVVFTAWRGADPLSDTDVFLYDVAAQRADVVLGGPAQQRFSDVSRGYVAAADFSEDPSGVFNETPTNVADIILFDRGTRAVSRRPWPGKQAFPLLVSPSRLGYLDWGEVHPEPKFSQYTLRVGDIQGAVANDVTVALVKNVGQYILPAGRNGSLEWVDSPTGMPTLWRVPADMSRPPAAVPGLDGLQLFAPAAAASFTIVGTMPMAGGPAILRGIGR